MTQTGPTGMSHLWAMVVMLKLAWWELIQGLGISNREEVLAFNWTLKLPEESSWRRLRCREEGRVKKTTERQREHLVEALEFRHTGSYIHHLDCMVIWANKFLFPIGEKFLCSPFISKQRVGTEQYEWKKSLISFVRSAKDVLMCFSSDFAILGISILEQS